jgi:mycothiol synthase
MNEALARDDMRASSDSEGMYVLKTFAADPEQFAGAFDGDELVGFVVPDLKVVVVRPDRRRQGIGRALVERGAAMTRELGRGEMLMGVAPGDADGAAFLAAMGFTFHSAVWDLDLPPDRAVPPPVWPQGHRARSIDRERDLDEWIRVYNASFADHPTPVQLNLKIVEGMLGDPDVEDADLILVEEERTGEIVGFCGTDPQRRDGRIGHHGDLWSIGVRPDRQGQGLGRQLVRAGVERVRGLGVPAVGLAVNARNEGALGLYESEGFVRTRTRERWSRPVAAETPS